MAALRQFLQTLEQGHFEKAKILSSPHVIDDLLGMNREEVWKYNPVRKMAMKWGLNPKGPMRPIIMRWAHEERMADIKLHPYDGIPSGLVADGLSGDAAICEILLVVSQRDDGSWYVSGLSRIG